MITAVVLCFVVVAADVPPVLQGIDTLPTKAAVQSIETRALTVMALDEKAKVVHRARALRLLGVRVDVDAAVFVTLRSSPISALRVQAALAQGAVATREEQLVPFAAGLLHDDDVEIRRAALTLLWVDRSAAAKDVVFAWARAEQDPALLHLAQTRLKTWPPAPTKKPTR